MITIDMITTMKSDLNIIENKKIQLISIIAQLYNFDILIEIEKLLLNTKIDWWSSISKAEQNAIDEGINDIKAGKVLSHQQVIQEFNNRYKDL